MNHLRYFPLTHTLFQQSYKYIDAGVHRDFLGKCARH
jgi:hypothetical protein